MSGPATSPKKANGINGEKTGKDFSQHIYVGKMNEIKYLSFRFK
jgi:hypothetical protein